MKKHIGKLLLPFLVVIAAVVVLIFMVKNKASLELTIGGVEISEEEYQDVMQGEVYEVTRYFYETYGAAVDGEFWGKEFQGEIPYQVLTDNTIKQLKYNHAVYQHAEEMRYVDSVTYEAFLERVEAENAARKEKIENGEPVYGLSEYTKELYMEYEMDVFQKQYCENVENEGMDISEEERQAYYEANKDMLFTAYDDIDLDYIMVYYETEEDAAKLRKQLTALYKKMDEKHSMKSLVEEEFPELAEYLVSESIASQEYSTYLRTIPDVLEYAMELEAGTSTQVIEVNNTFYLIECTGKAEHDYQSMDEVKDTINKELREEKYNQIIQKREEEIPVDGNMEQIYSYTKKVCK